MKVKQYFTPVNIAIALAVLLAVWLLLGDREQALEEAPNPQARVEQTIPQVQVRSSTASPWQRELVVQGQIQPWQEVQVKAQVSGRVERILKQQGERVSAGDTLLVLSDEGRTNRLQEARALLKLREKELESANTLEKSRFVSETEVSRLQSAAAQAEAGLEEAKLAAQYGRPVAPFDGVINRRHVEPGDLVNPADPLMDLVQIDRLKITAFIPQQQVAALEEGQPVTMELLDGRTKQGEVSFISYSADSQTRSYYFEVVTENPEHLRVAGASVTLNIKLPAVPVHKVSPALLSLDGTGELGVYTVDAQDTVQFYRVKTLSIDNQYATIKGLPESVRLITLGAGFVNEGDKVKPVEASE